MAAVNCSPRTCKTFRNPLRAKMRLRFAAVGWAKLLDRFVTPLPELGCCELLLIYGCSVTTHILGLQSKSPGGHHKLNNVTAGQVVGIKVPQSKP